MNKLDLSIGILSWKSHNTLINTLESYKKNGLLDMVKDVTIFFQEGGERDSNIAQHYGCNSILSPTNVGIGKALVTLAENAKTDTILLLENDWVLIESKEVTYIELQHSLTMLNKGIDVVKLRHRRNPGDPLYTRQYANREWDLPTHIFDCVHWRDTPHVDFPDIITRDLDTSFFVARSKNANFTNNPTMYRKKFYVDNITPFMGGGVDLEGKIQSWWENQNFYMAHGEGLFTHYRIDR